MRTDAVLINTSRGALVDEDALTKALRAGAIAGAALDVVSHEPLPDKSPLRDAPHLLITPHLAWATDGARRRLVQMAGETLRAWLDGSPIHVVTADAP